ncbi:hypothetical protein BC938DRAFT_477015 [Jimgerdemannia flammicorona]|uniref:LIM zinc-binding domain-containing protein n=1 Tax=Jimgerdemannia flammicorona TaxID=994334 RepID=A0A433QPW2_9FUNG|nr:hypothetical protein BC938DRAFT_477015 [Jimgerdemannia flammicorona]
MSVEPSRISQILPTVKCSDCGNEIGIHELGSHVCAKAPPLPKMPPLPAIYQRQEPKPSVSRGDSGDDNFASSKYPKPTESEQRSSNSTTTSSGRAAPDAGAGSGPNLPFLEKYKNLKGPAPSPSDLRSDNSPSGHDRYENARTTSPDNFDPRPPLPQEIPQSPAVKPFTPNSNDQSGRRPPPSDRYPTNGYNAGARPPPPTGYLNNDLYGRPPQNGGPVPQSSRSFSGDRPSHDRTPSRSNTMEEPSRYGNNGPARARSPAFLGQYPANTSDRNNSASPTPPNNKFSTSPNNDFDVPMRSPLQPRSPGADIQNDRYGPQKSLDDYTRATSPRPRGETNIARSPSPSGGKYATGYRRQSDDDERYDRAAIDHVDDNSNVNPDNILSTTSSGSGGRRPSTKSNDGYDNSGYDGSKRRPSTKGDHGVLDSLMQDLMKDIGGEEEEFDHPDTYGNGGGSYGKTDERARKTCGACGKNIDRRDDGLDAIGKTFHRSCFTCIMCGSRFDSRHPHKEYQGKLYCERDYYDVKQGKICATCNTPISSGKMVQALGQYYHLGHLKCHECRNPIDPDKGLVEHKGRVFCREDFANLYLPKCRGCGLPVEKEAVCALDGKLEGKWHRECFGCHTCRKPFPDNTFYVFENAPYCKRHYHKLNNSLCKTCDEPIEGPCAQTIEGWRFHPECFTCIVCREAITDVYYMFENKPYCETHILQLQRHRKVRAEKRQTYFKRI